MASVFKKARDRQRKGASWYINFTDEHGVRRQVKGCSDKTATEAMARKLESDAELRRRGVIDPREDAFHQHEARPIRDHLADFIRSLTNQEREPRYVQQVEANNQRIIDRAGMTRLSDLTADRVGDVLAGLRRDGLSLQTLNHNLRHAKSFSRWLAGNDRIRKDHLARMKGFNVATDRRHDRRALTAEELVRLLAAAEHGPVVQGMTGPDRRMLYHVALGTGFRANELRSLTPESFALDVEPPSVTVQAAYSKRRRNDVQPIRPDLADELRVWLAGKPTGRPVFRMPEKTAKMLRVDLEAAGIPYRDASGRYADFHASRHTYVSLIVRGGASVKVAQELARHSTPALTIGRYAHAALYDQTAALDALPDLTSPGPQPEADALTATGTEGRILAPLGHRAEDGMGRNVSGSDATTCSSSSLTMGPEPLENQASDATGRVLSVPVTNAPGGTRTPNHQFRRLMLYPIELRVLDPEP